MDPKNHTTAKSHFLLGRGGIHQHCLSTIHVGFYFKDSDDIISIIRLRKHLLKGEFLSQNFYWRLPHSVYTRYETASLPTSKLGSLGDL